MDFLDAVFHSDRIPPSAEVQEWAEKQASSNGERFNVNVWLSVLVVLVSLSAVAFGAYIATVGAIQAGLIQ